MDEAGPAPVRFHAIEEFAVEEVAFSWRARFAIVPLVSIRVVDRYAAGQGSLEARLFGIPVMRASGPETSEGEAMRYLAELAWVPHAIVANRDLEWRELDAQAVEVAARVGSGRAAIRLAFDDAGDLVEASTDRRPRLEGKKIVPRPWRGLFSDYASFGGVRVPTKGEVRWELPEGPFTYWRSRIASFELRSRTEPSPVENLSQKRSKAAF